MYKAIFGAKFALFDSKWKHARTAALAVSRALLLERLSMTFVPNGKRRSEIRVLPKMEEQCLILAHFCPVSSTSQATSQRKETS